MNPTKNAVRRPLGKSANARSDFRVYLSAGMLVTLVGAYSDAWWHLHGLAAKEGFFTPAHTVLYSGVIIMAVSIYLWRSGRLKLPIKVDYRAKTIMLLGIATMFGGAAFDFWWHSTYGFDVVAWTPPHLTATAGFVVLLSTAVVCLSKGSNLTKVALSLSIVLFAALWTTVIVLTA